MEQPNAEIRKYLTLIIKKRYIFIPIFLGIMSVIVWGSYLIPKKYEAKSIIFIESNVIEELVKGIAITPSMDARIKVLRDTMLSRSVVLNVMRSLDLDAQVKDDKELEEMINSFQREMQVKVSNNSLITVSFTHRDPMLGKNFINNLVNEYLEKNIFAKRKEAYDAAKFLDKQAAFFKEKMDIGENEIIKFRQDQGIYIALDERSIIDEIKNHTTDIESIKMKKNELIATKMSIESQLENEKPFTVAMFSKREIEGTIETLENRLRQLLIKYTDNYPEVLKLTAEIEVLKKQKTPQYTESSGSQRESEISMVNPIYHELKQKIMSTESELNALHAKEKYLTELIKNKEKELKNIPESKKKLSDLEKERDSFKNVYEQLLIRLGQSEVSKQMEIEDKATTFRIIEPAILPTIPVSPNIKMLILAGIVLGFLAGFGAVYLLDNLDCSIKSIDALKSMGVPVLAIIPTMQNSLDVVRVRRRDILLYSLTGLYVFCILGVFAMEYFGLTYVDEFISNSFVKHYL